MPSSGYKLNTNYAYYKSTVDATTIIHDMREHKPLPLLSLTKYATNAPTPLQPLIKNLIMHLFSLDTKIHATLNYFVMGCITTYKPKDDVAYALFKFTVNYTRNNGATSANFDSYSKLIDTIDGEINSYLQIVEPSDLDDLLLEIEPSGLNPFTFESQLYSLISRCNYDLYKTPLPTNLEPLTIEQALNLAYQLYDEVKSYAESLLD